MIFNSYAFLAFFPIVTLAYYLMPMRARRPWLLAASYYFYMCWNAQYALLIAASTLVTYLCALALGRIPYEKWLKFVWKPAAAFLLLTMLILVAAVIL